MLTTPCPAHLPTTEQDHSCRWLIPTPVPIPADPHAHHGHDGPVDTPVPASQSNGPVEWGDLTSWQPSPGWLIVIACTDQSAGERPDRRSGATGGGIAWGFGETPILLVTLVVFAQWVRSDARAARRFDRQAVRDGDAMLADYNAHLQQLHERQSKPA